MSLDGAAELAGATGCAPAGTATNGAATSSATTSARYLKCRTKLLTMRILPWRNSRKSWPLIKSAAQRQAAASCGRPIDTPWRNIGFGLTGLLYSVARRPKWTAIAWRNIRPFRFSGTRSAAIATGSRPGASRARSRPMTSSSSAAAATACRPPTTSPRSTASAMSRCVEKGWLGSGNVGRNTTIVRSNYLLPDNHPLLRALDEAVGEPVARPQLQRHVLAARLLNLAHTPAQARRLRPPRQRHAPWRRRRRAG